MRRTTSTRSARAGRGRRDDEADDRPPLLGLQHVVGNRAIAALVARDVQAGDAPRVPNLNLPADYVERQQEEVGGRVKAHLDASRAVYEGLIRSGASIAEIIDRVIAAVPDARRLGIAGLETLLRAHFRPLDIATHREPVDRPGQIAEIQAMARNAMGTITGGVRVGLGGAGVMSVGISGVTAAIGAPEGGKADGDRPLEATVGWDRSVKLTTRAPGVLFEAKISPPSREGGDIEWEIGLQFPGEDAMVPILSTLPGVFSAAEKGVREAVGEARRGGAGSYDRAKQHMAGVKDAVGAVSSVAAKHSGPRFGISAQGSGSNATIQATLTIAF